jgi:hypothetical protein
MVIKKPRPRGARRVDGFPAEAIDRGCGTLVC